MTVRYMVLNPPAKKRGKKKRKKPMATKRSRSRSAKKQPRRKDGRFKKKAGLRKRTTKKRSSAKRRKSPRRRTVRAARGTRVTVVAANPKRRRRRNPGKKKTATKKAYATRKGRRVRFKSVYRPYMRKGRKPSARVRRRGRAFVRGAQYMPNPRRRRRRNPGGRGLIATLKRNLKSLTRPQVYVNGAQSLAGYAAALALPAQLARRLPQYAWLNSGYYGVATSALATAVAATIASAVPGRKSAKLAENVMSGGMLATLTKLAFVAMPSQAARWIPMGEAQGSSASLAASLAARTSLSASPALSGLSYRTAARLPQGVAVGAWAPSRAEAF